MEYNKEVFSNFFFINTSGESIKMVEDKSDGSISFFYDANSSQKCLSEESLSDSSVIVHSTEKRSLKRIIRRNK